jgi:manganese-dependent inorganic pyrophosphatase
MITVLGHLNPDTDTTCSAIAYAWFLQQRGEEAEAVVPGNLNKETQFVLEQCGAQTPRRISSLEKGASIALVDTNNPEELVDGWQEAEILSIVDHHKLVGGLSTAIPIYIVMKPVACTATIIYELMRQEGIKPNETIAGLMLAAILSDTLKFTSPTTTQPDRMAAAELAEIAGLDTDQLADGMFTAKSDLSGAGPRDILMMDSKIFNLGNEKLRISVVETTNPSSALVLREQLEQALAELKEEEQLTGALCFVVDIINSAAEAIVPSAYEKQLVERAFNIQFSDATAHLPGVVSRKKQIVPQLEAHLTA